MGKFQAAAEAVFSQGCDVPGYDLVAADKEVCLDPLGSIGIVQHRVGIPGNGFAAAPVKGQAQSLLQGRIFRMGGQVLRQQETQRLQRLRRHLPAQALQIRYPGGIVGGLYRLRPAAVPLTTGNHKQ